MCLDRVWTHNTIKLIVCEPENNSSPAVIRKRSRKLDVPTAKGVIGDIEQADAQHCQVAQRKGKAGGADRLHSRHLAEDIVYAGIGKELVT